MSVQKIKKSSGVSVEILLRWLDVWGRLIDWRAVSCQRAALEMDRSHLFPLDHRNPMSSRSL